MINTRACVALLSSFSIKLEIRSGGTTPFKTDLFGNMASMKATTSSFEKGMRDEI